MTCSLDFICRFTGIQVLIFLERPWKVILGAVCAMDHQLRMDFIMTCIWKIGKISVSKNLKNSAVFSTRIISIQSCVCMLMSCMQYGLKLTS